MEEQKPSVKSQAIAFVFIAFAAVLFSMALFGLDKAFINKRAYV
jgi:flagellar basal body-associated protein FliL